MYVIYFYAPMEHKEKVKDAMFAAGAGRIGKYQHCSFEVIGQGQFQASVGARPFLGEINKLEKIVEAKIEMVCADEHIVAVIEALRSSHPYETPVFHVIKTEDVE